MICTQNTKQKYTEEQISTWAYLKHTSYEEPSNKKFWKTSGSAGSSQGISGSKSKKKQVTVDTYI